jgi:hypothetical protein
VIRAVTEDEIWCEFLRSEFHDYIPRHHWGECERLTNNPDFENQKDNLRRLQLLQFREPIVSLIPYGTSWSKVSLSNEELLQLYAIRYGSWKALTEGSYLLRDGAKNLRNPNWSIAPMMELSLGDYLQDTRDQIESIRVKVSKMVKENITGLPILIRQVGRPKLTVIEGCHRITARIIRRTLSTEDKGETKVLLGESPNMTSCPWLVP